MATSVLQAFDTQHEDMIHDAQLDFYGKRLATSSSDRTIRIHELEGESHRLVQELRPVWQVAWAHPKFGSLLASCSYDGKVFVWKEDATGSSWTKLYEHAAHSASVNSIAWAPHEFGVLLACGSSDGKVSVLSWKEDGSWSVAAEFIAHQAGCNAVSWAPSSVPGSLIQVSGGASSSGAMRLATGGSDNFVKVWKSEADGTWSGQPEFTLDGHSDWIRDVQFAPNIGLPCTYLASCSQDKTVIVWTQDQEGGPWTKKLLKAEKFPEVLWRVSWSLTGNILSVAGGDNKVSLWQQTMDGQWACISELEENSPNFATAK